MAKRIPLLSFSSVVDLGISDSGILRELSVSLSALSATMSTIMQKIKEIEVKVINLLILHLRSSNI